MEWSTRTSKRHQTYHLVAAAHKDGDGLGVFALFNDQHAVLGGAKGHLTDDARRPQLVGRQLAEAGNNTSASSDGNQLQACPKRSDQQAILP